MFHSLLQLPWSKLFPSSVRDIHAKIKWPGNSSRHSTRSQLRTWMNTKNFVYCSSPLSIWFINSSLKKNSRSVLENETDARVQISYYLYFVHNRYEPIIEILLYLKLYIILYRNAYIHRIEYYVLYTGWLVLYTRKKKSKI